MEKRDEGVSLAAAVGEFQLADGFLVLACQALHYILSHLAQVVGGIGEREELRRVFVEGPPALLHSDFVEIGGEGSQREFAGAEIVTQRDDVMPGGPG